MNLELSAFLVPCGTSILSAMRQLEETAQKVLFVVDGEERLVGSLTDGDIRRWILAEGDLQETVERVCNQTPFQVGEDYDLSLVRRIMVEKKISSIPVVNGGNHVVDLLFWEDLFEGEVSSRPTRRLDIPVVIMAGGKGTRLDPFTQILPKPLIPLGEKTVVEHIIEYFLKFGVSRFYLSVNEKSRIIKSYFEELSPSYAISYIEEDQPLGTAGSLRYLQRDVGRDSHRHQL